MVLAQTLAERVLAHLAKHPVDADAADVPIEVTQEGIAKSLGAQLAHVSRALKALEAKGHTQAHLAHPRGAKRRSRAYTLTDTGHEKARGLEVPPGPAEAPRTAPLLTAAPAHADRVPAGREAQAAVLEAALDASAKGALRIALVEGDAGMGRSRLLTAIAARAQARGIRVLTGQGAPTGATQLLGPLARALEPLGFDRRFRAHAVGTPHERAHAAALEAITQASRAEPLLLILDDLHLAGPSVAEFLHGLVRALPSSTRLTLILAFRQEEAWQLPNGPLYTALTPLRDLASASHVSLPPLDEAGVAALLKDAGAHHVPRDLVARVARESGGNPLYALAMADAMLDGVDEEDFFPASVRALATGRFASLADTERAILQAAAVCGPEFDYPRLLKIYDGNGESALLAGLDILLDRLLLEEVADSSDALRLRFTHPKVREAVLAEMSSTRRRWLEGRLAA